jgi:hypothetical protein
VAIQQGPEYFSPNAIAKLEHLAEKSVITAVFRSTDGKRAGSERQKPSQQPSVIQIRKRPSPRGKGRRSGLKPILRPPAERACV